MSEFWACFPLLLGFCQPGLRASWAGGLGKGVVDAWAMFTPLLWSFPWAEPLRGAWCSGLGLPQKVWGEIWSLLTQEENDAFCVKQTLWLNCSIRSEFLHSMKKLFWLKNLFQLSLQAISMCIYNSTWFKSRACFWTKISFWHLLNHASIFITEW